MFMLTIGTDLRCFESQILQFVANGCANFGVDTFVTNEGGDILKLSSNLSRMFSLKGLELLSPAGSSASTFQGERKCTHHVTDYPCHLLHISFGRPSRHFWIITVAI